MKQKTGFQAVFCSKNAQRAILTLSGMNPDEVGNFPDMVRESLTRVGSSFTCAGESLTMVGDSPDIPGIFPAFVTDYFTLVRQLPAYSEIMPEMVRIVLFRIIPGFYAFYYLFWKKYRTENTDILSVLLMNIDIFACQ